MPDTKKILVIDDDQDLLYMLDTVLSKEGFNVTTALSGREGVEAIRNNKPDLILCDMMMESIDAGLKTAQEIRGIDSDIPIFLISSIAEATAASIETTEIGFNGIFQKPLDPAYIVNTVKNFLKL